VHPDLKFAIQVAPLVLIAATGAMIWANARPRRRPRRLVTAAGAFTVPANRRFRLLQIANPAAWALYAVGAIVTSDSRYHIIQTITFVIWSLFLLLALGVEVVLVWVYRRPPITLTPAGVRLKLRTFSWDSLDISIPWSIPTWPLPGYTSFPELDADPAFIAAAIYYYRRNPAARAAIGQPDEHERLLTALSSAS
jgi:hypothetical protein